mgnify:CR=1 FL=1
MSEELVNADIRLAKTLPSEFYTDEAHFEAQRNAFRTTWQFMGASSQFMSAVSPLPHLDALLGGLLFVRSQLRIVYAQIVEHIAL